MISVIIPVLDSSDSVASVVRLARCDPSVGEVIVVDHGSIGGIREMAVAAGARVIPSTLSGRGDSMEEGMRAARNEVLLYLDGDLDGLHEDLIARMTAPVVQEWADFVKAAYSHTAGRLTALIVGPTLQKLFPELAEFAQPLGGIIAARRSLLQGLPFETDYGVDIGLLIDAKFSGAIMAEANIGYIEQDRHSLESFGETATQVVRTLLDRAVRYGRLNKAHVEEVQRHMDTELSIIFRRAVCLDSAPAPSTHRRCE